MADESVYGNSSGGGDERLQGRLSMTPIAKGAPTAARASVNTTPNRITPDLKAALPGVGPEKAQRVRDVVSRKP